MSDFTEALARIHEEGGPAVPGTWRLEDYEGGTIMVCRTADGRVSMVMHPDDFEALRAEQKSIYYGADRVPPGLVKK